MFCLSISFLAFIEDSAHRFPRMGQKNCCEVPIAVSLKLQGQSTYYNLNSVVVHIGNSLDTGHYVAIGKCPNQHVYCFSDSNVSISLVFVNF